MPQFANILADGPRGDYIALVEKRNFEGLNFMKAGRSRAEKLLSEDPAYYDAYLAIGVENYLLSLNLAPVRWLLRLGGARPTRTPVSTTCASPPPEGTTSRHLRACCWP
jgi:hypothetical protein